MMAGQIELSFRNDNLTHEISLRSENLSHEIVTAYEKMEKELTWNFGQILTKVNRDENEQQKHLVYRTNKRI